MSTNATDTGSASSSTASQSLSATIHPLLNTLMISHTFLSLLIPLTISLFYFSTPQGRRRPIFILNLAAISLAFLVGVLIDAIEIDTILEPLNPWPLVLTVTVGFVIVWQSILVDLTLLIRLISVYPARDLGPMHFTLLISIPVLLKLTRAINIIIFTKVMVEAVNGPNGATVMQIDFTTKPYLKIEWAAQMIDNTYASLAFLWRMRGQGTKRIMTNCSRMTLAQRMRTLSRIALLNFVVPTMFSIVQFVCVCRNVSVTVLNQIILTNAMLATIGVVFATVWAGSINRQEAQTLDSTHGTESGLEAIFGLGGAERAVGQSSTVMVADSAYLAIPRDERSNA